MTKTQAHILRELLETGTYFIEGERDKSAAEQLEAESIVRIRENHLARKTNVVKLRRDDDLSETAPREVLKIRRRWLQEELDVCNSRIQEEL